MIRDGFEGVEKKRKNEIRDQIKSVQNYGQWLSYLSGGELAPANTIFLSLEAYLDPLQFLQQGRPLLPPCATSAIHRSSKGQGLQSEPISQTVSTQMPSSRLLGSAM